MNPLARILLTLLGAITVTTILGCVVGGVMAIIYAHFMLGIGLLFLAVFIIFLVAEFG